MRRDRVKAKRSGRVDWRTPFSYIAACVVIFILIVSGPMNYFNLKNIQLDGGELENVYRTTRRRSTSERLVLVVDGERYWITETCADEDLKNLYAILQRRIGEHVYLRYREDFTTKRFIVELDYMGLKLVDYDYAMARLEPALKERAYVSVGAGLLYALLLVVLKRLPNLLKY